MNESKYQLGDTIPGTIGKVVGRTYSSDDRWVYTIQFAGGHLTIGEDNIDEAIVDVLSKPNEESNG
ncbi:MAG: hypothetical protein AAFQ14_09780 [Cyanobacteria bacterium J06621_12]